MATKKSNLLTQLTPHIKGFKFPFVIAVLGAVIANIITVYGPQQISKITNLITEGIMGVMDIEMIGRLSLFMAILYITSAVINYLQAFILNTIVQRFSRRLRSAIAHKINRVPLSYFDSHSQGDTLSRVTNDVDTASQSLTQSVGTLITSVTLLVGAVAMMFVTNHLLALTAIVSTAVGFVGVTLIMGRARGFFKAQQANLAAINGYVEESYTGHNVITSYNAIEENLARFATLNSNLYQSMWKSQFISGIMMPMMMFIGNFSYVMVCVIGSVLLINGHISMGVIVAFMMYVRIFSQPLQQLSQALTQLQAASAAMERVLEFLNEEELEDESSKIRQLKEVKGRVTFEKVFFGYNSDKTIIHDFSAQAKPGQKVAIVGPTGAGKTTIVNLLMKFYEIDSGRIAIDGVDIKDMTRSEVHDQFSMVLQDTWLFEGTIRDNLVYNQKNISEEQVLSATKAVGVHHFIMTLPEGYDTVLDDTVTLSVGQRQLLTIARALLKDAPLLILDEATSSVDTRTEELIQQAMDKLMEGRTSFVIAHRLSTIRNADLILVMKDGNIIEQGNHDELMTQSGFYANLYNSQFEKGNEEVA
ncbi:ABC transporter ATP-binding protein [Streptococcus merionis]|uniref:ABC-type multidrug/protein/lipid transport system, ATPase component n=1 Tax=Streptococcus merionis TaxID=400065 RepID=A0A239SMP9_9STRE|nr:ABC transporter ATP-binding protein [Streptococcus merionis]SNU86138.1 ABC-type multidrug/protein/lipid transport system, ATPase component [Streptococcus merionis]